MNRDFKLENMLVSEDNTIKIADFGFAIPIEGRNSDGLIKTTLGTPGYMAPEIVEKRHYDGEKAEIFALGTILFAMRSKKMPFCGVGQNQVP